MANSGMKRGLAGLLGCVLALNGWSAEFRTWTSKKGQQVEACYFGDSGSRVVLKRRNGKKITLPISALCEEDQNYIYLQKPPRVKVLAKKSMRSGNTDYDYDNKRQKFCFEVFLEKQGSRPYPGELVVHLCVLGKSVVEKDYVVLDKYSETFSFTKSRKHSFTSKEVELEYDDNDSAQFGVKYEGYLVWIETKDGEMVHCEGSRKLFEQHPRAITKLAEHDCFDRTICKTRRFGQFTPGLGQ